MSKRYRSILGVIFSTIFSVSIFLSLSYLMNIIFLIGDNPQLIPLFSGIVLGTITFVFLGSFIKSDWNTILGGAIISIALYIISYIILLTFHNVFQDYWLAIISFMLTSTFLPVMLSVRFYFNLEFNKIQKIIFFLSSSILAIILTFIIAIYYISSGQTSMPQELISVDTISIILLFIYVIMDHDSK